MVKELVFDIEADNLNTEKVSNIHCLVAMDFETGEMFVFTDHKEMRNFIRSNSDALWIGHNITGYDLRTIENVLGVRIKNYSDTFVLSRMINFNKFFSHSLAEIGEFIGEKKIDYEGGFDRLTDEMLEYCKQDVRVTAKFWGLVRDFYYKFKKACDIEIAASVYCSEIGRNGFWFDKEKALEVLQSLEQDAKRIEEKIQREFGKQKTFVKKIKYRVKTDGSLFETTRRAIEEYVTERDGNDLLCYEWTEFDLASRKMVIDALWEAGWEPTSKTKGHIKKERDGAVDDEVLKYGWKLDEENLATLPETAPESAQLIAEWLTLDGRIKPVKTWLEAFDEETNCIHPTIYSIGCWSHRCSHTNPNTANIASPFKGEPKTGVEKVKAKYDSKLRSLWTVPENHWLVGVDAEGIQLRVLAHEMAKVDDSESTRQFIKAIESGRKEDKTDIHNLNLRLLGPVCKDRDTAKTFIYAFLLGASNAKIAEILECSIKEARKAVALFLDRLPALKKLKYSVIPRDAERGFLIGLDGRPVRCSSKHLMLTGYLQSGEAIVMKTAMKIWKSKLVDAPYKLVNFVHDEWQTETRSRIDAKIVGQTQAKAIEEAGRELGMKIKLKGEYKIGKSWLETH